MFRIVSQKNQIPKGGADFKVSLRTVPRLWRDGVATSPPLYPEDSPEQPATPASLSKDFAVLASWREKKCTGFTGKGIVPNCFTKKQIKVVFLCWCCGFPKAAHLIWEGKWSESITINNNKAFKPLRPWRLTCTCGRCKCCVRLIKPLTLATAAQCQKEKSLCPRHCVR